MIATLPKSVKLWGRGQLTIPKEARQALKLNDESQLSVFVVGQCLVLTQKRLTRASLAKEVGKSMVKKGVSLKNLLDDLKAERQRHVQDHPRSTDAGRRRQPDHDQPARRAAARQA